MRTLAWILVLAAVAAADETATKKWLTDEHGKLLAAAKKEGLIEEALEEARWASVVATDGADKGAAVEKVGRPWITHWDDGMQKKFVAFVAKRKEMRKAAAQKLTALGTEKETAGDKEGAAAAWRWAVRYDADCKEAHAKLGEALVEKQGWFAKDDADKRKKGLLPVGKDWVPAKEAEARHLKWAEPWVVTGEHFEVTSNHSLAGAQDVLARAEEMYTAVVRELNGLADAPKTDGLMKIYYFASRADLDEHDRTAHGDRPGLKNAPGFFSNEDKIGHFFPLPSNAVSTLQDVVRHEGAHEVAYYLWKAEGTPPARPHFWAWEGFATYFESAESKDGKVLVGSPNHLRVKTFRDEFAAGKHVPIAEFVTLDQRGISGKYPQCAALTTFFMNAGEGKYREQFVAYLKVIHEAKAEADTFEKSFGKKPAEFQAEWEAYVKAWK